MSQHPDNDKHEQETIASQQAKKAVKKQGKKIAKKVAKAAVKAVAKASLALVKVLLGLLGGIGTPFLLIIGGSLVTIFLIYLIVAMIFSNSPESLEGEPLALRNHIVAVADATVDMSRPEQIPYRVPHELIISALQIYKSGNHGVSDKEAASIMGETLAPIFTYEEKEGRIETVVTTCEDGSCSTSTSYTPFILELLKHVEAWDRVMEATFTPYTTDWVVSTSTSTSWKSVEKIGDDGKVIPNEYESVPVTVSVTTKTRTHTWLTEEVVTEDYTYYDLVLSNPPFEYGQEDKLLVEAIYQATGGSIRYKEWLTGNSLVGIDGTVIPGEGIPAEFMPYYLEAEKKYKVDWYYLAAIHFVETGFSTHPTMISSVGAEGHMQFMPCTWIGWSYPGCVGSNGFVAVPDSVKHNVGVISKHGGYGVDANGDGKASPWDAKDAIFATAKYLSGSGFSKNIDQAIRNYNHSDIYVSKVKEAAQRFKNAAIYMPGDGEVPDLVPGSFMRPAAGSISSKYGPRNLKNGFHYGTDIANSAGTSIVSMADGVVIKSHSGCPPNGNLQSKCGGGWGNHVYIEHVVQGQKFIAVYAHFNKTVASNGQKVKQGQIVGLMGASGSVTGVHLHVELHKGFYKRPNNVLNPGLYIPF